MDFSVTVVTSSAKFKQFCWKIESLLGCQLLLHSPKNKKNP
jgi:hypothetical protein